MIQKHVKWLKQLKGKRNTERRGGFMFMIRRKTLHKETPTIKEPNEIGHFQACSFYVYVIFCTRKHVLSMCVFHSQSLDYLSQFKPLFVILLLLELISYGEKIMENIENVHTNIQIYERLTHVWGLALLYWRGEGLDLIEVCSFDQLLYFWLAGLIPVYHVMFTAKMIARTQLSLRPCVFNVVAVPLSWTVDELLCVCFFPLV